MQRCAGRFLLKASKIDKIYVHDDQVGPFARMTLDSKAVDVWYNDHTSSYETLSTSWRGRDGNIGSIRAVSDLLLIPLYHKIRIPYGVIHDHIMCLDTFIDELRQNQKLNLVEKPEWDIYLTTVNDFKKRFYSLLIMPISNTRF